MSIKIKVLGKNKYQVTEGKTVEVLTLVQLNKFLSKMDKEKSKPKTKVYHRVKDGGMSDFNKKLERAIKHNPKTKVTEKKKSNKK